MGVARRLALGRLISLSGGSAAYIALVAAIYGRTHSAVWISAAIFAATSSAGYLAGPLLGGLVLGAGASPSAVFAVDAATFVVSALLVATIRRPFGSGATDEHPGLLAGFRVIVREPRLRIPVLAIGLGVMALAGAGRGLGDVAATTLIQEQTSDAVRGRVFAAQEGAAHVAFSVSALSGGLIVQLASARGAFAVATAFGAAAALVAATGLSRAE